MKAITYTEYGSVDVLKLTEVEKPTPGDKDVLIQVHATAANAGDWHLSTAPRSSFAFRQAYISQSIIFSGRTSRGGLWQSAGMSHSFRWAMTCLGISPPAGMADMPSMSRLRRTQSR